MTTTPAKHTHLHNSIHHQFLPSTVAEYMPLTTQTIFPCLLHTSYPSSTLAYYIPSHPFNLAKSLECQTSNQGKVQGYFGHDFHLISFTYLLLLTIIIQICAHYYTHTSSYHHYNSHSVILSTYTLFISVSVSSLVV